MRASYSMQQRIQFLRQQSLENLMFQRATMIVGPRTRSWFLAKSRNAFRAVSGRQDILERPLNSIYFFANHSDGLLVP
jgi:hypothetical protein